MGKVVGVIRKTRFCWGAQLAWELRYLDGSLAISLSSLSLSLSSLVASLNVPMLI